MSWLYSLAAKWHHMFHITFVETNYMAIYSSLTPTGFISLYSVKSCQVDHQPWLMPAKVHHTGQRFTRLLECSDHIRFKLRCCPCPILWGWTQWNTFCITSTLPHCSPWLFPLKGPVIQSFYVSFHVRLYKLLDKQSGCWWMETQ